MDPVGDQDSGLVRAIEVLAVEQLVAHRAVALHVGVLLLEPRSMNRLDSLTSEPSDQGISLWLGLRQCPREPTAANATEFDHRRIIA
jgi:hypothetical protein